MVAGNPSQQTPKKNVSQNGWPSVIASSRPRTSRRKRGRHLSVPDVTVIAIAVYPPARTSNPQTPVYMTLQLPGRTARGVTTRLVSSYLTFSPLLFEKSGYFLLHYSTLTDCLPLTSGMPYVARTFLFHLPREVPATNRPTAFKVQRYENFCNSSFYSCENFTEVIPTS